ncbi:MAG: coproporphyrinogen dehydrogenase HemZ [Oscillospiraceae bacterium]|nr:coproporphyrinogen dehydrogenase HemZ [Oscillospiraceae bacterium]
MYTGTYRTECRFDCGTLLSSYEILNTVRIFLPGGKCCSDPEQAQNVSDCILVGQRADGTVYAEVRLEDRTVTRTAPAPVTPDEDALEFAVCSLLYEVLREMTGYTPPWGLITGIRPVRKVIQLLENGKTPDEAAAFLRRKYHISAEKMQLALDTALVQQPILPHSPKEIGFYVSIPFCPTRCSYCSFVSHSMQSAYKLIPDYIARLCEEIEVCGQIIREHGLTVQSVYIGGGTPTSITAEQLRQVMETVRSHIDIGSAREYTVEAGRADTITAEKLRVIQEEGATRISVNPQTLQDNVLQAIGRDHTAQQAVDAFRLARSMGFDDINMDLIAGLPSDTLTGFTDTLEKILALAPDSITVHTLTLKRAADLHGSLGGRSSGELADVMEMAALSAKSLPAHGYRPYYLYRQKNTLGNLENVGYARQGKENLYNILIMDETQTILAAGCAASTKIVSPSGDISRIINHKFPYEYIHRFDQILLKKQKTRELLACL